MIFFQIIQADFWMQSPCSRNDVFTRLFNIALEEEIVGSKPFKNLLTETHTD